MIIFSIFSQSSAAAGSYDGGRQPMHMLQVGPEDHVICALSGGVDSTVAATLVHKVLGERLHCVFVDNGLLRYKEAERVMNTFQKHLHLPVTKIDGAERMLKLLQVKSPLLLARHFFPP